MKGDEDMLHIFNALYDLFVSFMVTEVAAFVVVALALTAILHGTFLSNG